MYKKTVGNWSPIVMVSGYYCNALFRISDSIAFQWMVILISWTHIKNKKIDSLKLHLLIDAQSRLSSTPVFVELY